MLPTRLGSNLQTPDYQSNPQPNEPPRPAKLYFCYFELSQMIIWVLKNMKMRPLMRSFLKISATLKKLRRGSRKVILNFVLSWKNKNAENLFAVMKGENTFWLKKPSYLELYVWILPFYWWVEVSAQVAELLHLWFCHGVWEISTFLAVRDNKSNASSTCINT